MKRDWRKAGRCWWQEGLRLDFRIRPMGLALSALYALACLAARQISLDQFHLPAGIRVAALLLTPPRLWPYLVLGEYAYLAHIRYPLIEQLGVAWATIGSVLLIPLVAVVVRLHSASIKSKQGYWLLSLAFFSSVLIAVVRLSTMHLLWPIPPEESILASMGRHVLGEYLGILTVAPIALLWIKRQQLPTENEGFRALTVASVVLLILLGIVSTHIPSEMASTKTTIQLMAIAPAAALTCLHGWHGAALGVPMLNMAIHLATPSTDLPGSFDDSTFGTQQSVAIISTALLALGASLSHYRQQCTAGAKDRTQAMELSRSSAMAGEMDLRERALQIRELGDRMDQSLSELADWLRNQGHHPVACSLLNVTVVHSRKFREQVSMVFPTSLEHIGLYLALQIGGVNDVWRQTERVTLRRLIGDPCNLSIGLQLAAYRSMTEAVSLLLTRERGQIQVQARCGTFQRRRGILVVVALLDREHHLSEETVTLAVERLAGRLLAYGGTVRGGRNRVRMLLVDAGA